MRFQVIFAVFFWVFSQVAHAETAAANPAAKQTVDKLNNVLIEVMKNANKLGYPGRYKKLEPVVKDVFQFEAVAQIALGSHWKKLDQNQKLAFVAKLTDLSIATYAAQFNDYGGEKFQFESTSQIRPDRLIQRYVLVVPNEKPIQFDYIVNEFNGKWQIINIIVDGISDLALKKAQYTSVMDREGFDSLLAKLNQKISDYAKNNAG